MFSAPWILALFNTHLQPTSFILLVYNWNKHSTDKIRMNCSFSFTTRGCKRIDNQVQLILSCSVTHTSHQWIDLFLSLSKQKRKFSVSTMFMGSGFSRPWETDIPKKSKNNPPKKLLIQAKGTKKLCLFYVKRGLNHRQQSMMKCKGDVFIASSPHFL